MFDVACILSINAMFRMDRDIVTNLTQRDNATSHLKTRFTSLTNPLPVTQLAKLAVLFLLYIRC